MNVFLAVFLTVLLFVAFCFSAALVLESWLSFDKSPRCNVVKMVIGGIVMLTILSLFCWITVDSKKEIYEKNVAKYGESCAKVIREADERAERHVVK